MKTKHRIFGQLTVLFIMVVFAAIQAADVSKNDILAASRKWIADNAVFKLESPNAVPADAMQLTDKDGQLLPLWRVDLQPAGYLVMSSDDTLPPVVTFNTNGSFELPEGHPLPDLLKRQGEIFQEELDKPQTRGNEFASENQARWNALLGRTRADSVTPSEIITAPMLTTKWNQSMPYNFICPSGDAYMSRAITGCTAVAFSQMLKYHEWPPVGQGTASHNDTQGAITGSFQVDYSFPYDWNCMQDSHSSYYQLMMSRNTWAVSRLLMEMGVFATADFEVGSTGAPDYRFRDLLSTMLGYEESAQYGWSEIMAQATLYSRIHADMVAGRPAFVAGTRYDENGAYAGGHAFIADGLSTMDSLDYYHFNFGWGGSRDGWYLLTDASYRSYVIDEATTGIMPKPIPVFKPMSLEQASSFTLSWDFPKRLTVEAFRLTKTSDSTSTVVSSAIDGAARSYSLTEQSGTATYTLEAKVDGNWQAASDGVTVTIKTNPMPMLSLMVDDELNSVKGQPFTTIVVANNALQSLAVKCSRPDMLPDGSITVTGSGISHTISFTPAGGLVGNAILYLTGVDTVGNVAKQTVLLRVLDNTLTQNTTFSNAQSRALLMGKNVLMVSGSEGNANTSFFLDTVCEDVDVKANLLANYELWYDSSLTGSSSYASDLGGVQPYIAIIDPSDRDTRLRGHGGRMTADEAKVFLDTKLPYFSLTDETLTAGTTQSLELSVLDPNAEIRYGLDSSEPTASSMLYSNAIQLSGTTTVSARAFKYGLPISGTITKTYTFLEQVATPTLNVGETELFSEGCLVTATCATAGATLRYTIDGSLPTDASPVFPADGLAVSEDTLLMVCAFKTGMKPSEAAVSQLFSVSGIISGGIGLVGDETTWFAQTGTYNTAPSAMQSQDIDDNGTTTLTAIVTGGGELSFYWKVSSEANFDKLSFSIDGAKQDEISGTKDWEQKTYTVSGDGEHRLVWKYTKDSSVSFGGDCGWVDDIVWIPNRPPVSIAIGGPVSVATASTGTYTCTATWNDGTTSTVNPIWSLSSTDYASVSTSGVVTNNNTTTSDKTVTLNASYTSNGVTKTDSKTITLTGQTVKTLVSISISGNATIATAGTASYTCTATWSDGTTSNVTPTYSLSSTTYAGLSSDTVSNKNTTTSDQTVTLNASYTAGDVTKMASKTITLSKKELTGIAISGNAIIATASTATYTCTATWSYGDSTTVTPTWTITPTTYVSVSTSGVVMNKNTTTTAQTATLNASYTINGVTKTDTKTITLSKKELTGIAISGNATIATASTATYTCTATWSYGDSTTVTPTWTVIPTTYASVSTSGVVTNQNTTMTDQTVTLNASYTAGDVTKTASKTITLSKKELTGIAITGDSTIATASTATYICTATWSYGDATTVTPTWTVTPTTYASVSEAGIVANQNTETTDQTMTLNASYTAGNVTKTASKTITLSGQEAPALTAITINGPATIDTVSTATYTCTASWSDGTTSTVIPAWSVTPTTYASVDATGKLTNQNTTMTDQTVTLTSSYTAGDVTKTDTKTITLKAEIPASDTQTLTLEPGWNWVSFNVLPTSHKVGDVLGTAGFTANDIIQTNGASARFTGDRWHLEKFTVEFGKMYQIYVANAVTVEISGEACESLAVPLMTGWNWIGNLTSAAVSPSQLTHSGGWTANDRIQTSGGASATYTGDGWVPADFTLEPGKGYQIHTANEGTLTFPEPEPEPDEALYVVVDLSGGPNAESYPVRYTNEAPNLDDDTCRTTELWLRQIPSGTFIMGSPEDELGRGSFDMAQHEVTISQKFYMGVFECTQRQWKLVMGNTPSAQLGDTRPVENVSYYMIRGTSSSAGMGWPANGHDVDATSFMGVLQAKTGLVFDLPTEAQWEYACRAGTTTALNSGTDLASTTEDATMSEIGRYDFNRNDGKGGYSQHTKVGCYLPNAWGLYDMHGNVWELCVDWWGASISSTSPETDPVGPITGTQCLERGGRWGNNAWSCRSANRTKTNLDDKNDGIGFRVAIHPKQDLYVVVDLSGGPDAESYPVRYTNEAPNLDDDTCRTTELWLRQIPAGTIVMGSPEEEVGRRDNSDMPLHEVTISKMFYIGVFECTQKQWELVMGVNPSNHKGDTRPVEQVSYNMIRGSSPLAGGGWPSEGHNVDSMSFLGKIQQKTRLTFDLPTEAEWEFACRAGTTTSLNSGMDLARSDEDENMDEVGRYSFNRDDGNGGYTQHTAVGSYQPNVWGLYDMHGNVYEWCLDWYQLGSDMVFTTPVTDPFGPMTGSRRVMRGGSWVWHAQNCRSANRDGDHSPDECRVYAGFRVVFHPRRDWYAVVDLSDGPDAESYPVRYTSSAPNLDDDTCRTTELWLRRIPAGTFVMGAPSNELGLNNGEMAQHTVTLTQDYYIGVFECTQKQWELVMGNRPSYFNNASYYSIRPVECVSYSSIRGTGAQSGAGWPSYGHAVDSSSFMGKLQEKTGLAFDLPTEAQWEYACRAGTTTALNTGRNLTAVDSDGDVSEAARYMFNGGSGYSQNCSPANGTAKVGSYLPNAWGLYDMHGNVNEWCLDWWGANTSSTAAVTDPIGPSSGSYRVLRSGHWNCYARYCRSVYRGGYYSTNFSNDLGFRIAIQPKQDLYAVVDLSGGPNASSYPVRYTSKGPDLSNDTCRTTELWLRQIPAGTFIMGSPNGEIGRWDGLDMQKHQVTLTQSFYVGVFEVTQKQWNLVKGSNPSQYLGDCRPVERLSYGDIRGTSATGGAGWPVYGHNVDNDSFMGILRQKTGLLFDLPTDAQWEYACRAGTSTALNSGKNLTGWAQCPNLAEVGRYYYNRSEGVGGYTNTHTKVGSYLPNAWGLYDMHGNVFEWCLDWWGADANSTAAVTDPVGPESGENRLLRGGDWGYESQGCRSGYRANNRDPYIYYRSGFRVVFLPETASE